MRSLFFAGIALAGRAVSRRRPTCLAALAVRPRHCRPRLQSTLAGADSTLASMRGAEYRTWTAFSALGAPAFASVNNSLFGAIGGGQAGFNWQTGTTVVGAEADF